MTNEAHLFTVLKKPHVSEKTEKWLGENAVCVFRVAKSANKAQIKKAVKEIFGYVVDKVRVLNVKPKPKRFRGRLGSTKGWKKAYITFKERGNVDLSIIKK